MKKSKTIIKVLSFFAMAFLILTLGSCALMMIPSRVLPTDYVPTEGNSYIYGRFFKAHKEGMDMYGFVGLVIKNLDTSKQYNFLLYGKEEDTVQILAVPPGNYQIESFKGINQDGLVVDSTEFSFEGYQKDFTVALSTAVYLGDFTGKVDYMGNIIEYTYYQPENKYDNTTADLQEKFLFLQETNVTFVSNMEAAKPDKVAVKEMYNNIITKLFNSYKKFFNIEQPSMS